MEYKIDDLKKIYNESINNKNSFIELNDIAKELSLVCSIMEYDEIILQDIIDTLNYFKKINILYNINKESLNLLRKIAFNNHKEIFKDGNIIFIDKYLRNLFLPFNKNKCDQSYNIKYFLSEFDIFLTHIRDNCNINDYIMIHKYNKDLYEITGRFNKLMNDLDESEIFIYGGLKEKLLLTGLLNHIATMLYFSLDKFDYDYDLLYVVYEEMTNNFIELVMTCDDNKIFQGLMPIDENETEREYIFAFNMLKNKYDEKNRRRK